MPPSDNISIKKLYCVEQLEMAFLSFKLFKPLSYFLQVSLKDLNPVPKKDCHEK